MGSKKSSSTTQNQTFNETNNIDKRIAAGDHSLVATEGAQINAHIEMLDGGAIAGMENVAALALGGMADVANRTNENASVLALSALSTANEMAGSAIASSRAAQSEMLRATDNMILRAGEMFEDANESEAVKFSELMANAGKWVVVAGAVVAGIYFFKKAS